MLPSSHHRPIEAQPIPGLLAEGDLSDAFSIFIAAANRLEDSHRLLQTEVARLRGELEEQNRALAASLAENDQMRVALKEILDGLPCGVAVIEMPAERLVLLNPEAHRLLDIPSGKKNGIPHWISPAIAATTSSPLEHGYEQEISVERSGKKHWLAVRYSKLSHTQANENTAQIILIIRDVTGPKLAEQERDAARNAIAIAEMSAVLAHEIRNPLGSLELLAECLTQDSGLNHDSRLCVEHIQVGVRSLSATVNNVLRFHRPGKSTMRPLEVCSVLRSSFEFVRPLANQKDVKLTLEEAVQMIEVLGDPDELKQVFLNLFCNSLRHTPAGGALRVSVQTRGGTAAIEFADTGTGISAEDIPHIFEAGFSTTGSSGLGLAVCRNIVEQHSGKLMVESQLGTGATFRLEIPVL